MSREEDFLNGLMQANKRITALESQLSAKTRECEESRAALKARGTELARETAHLGDPCIYCGIPHDEVPVGSCPATRDVLRTDRDALKREVEEARAEVEKWKTLFYESEEYNCSCNIVDTTKPIGDPMNYVCSWHENHPHIAIEREKVITIHQRMEQAEKERDALKHELEAARKSSKLFPIQDGPAIPWAVIEPHKHQCELNHSQSIKRLAERGGLCCSEAVAVLEDREWHHIDHAEARQRLMDLAGWIPPQQAHALRAENERLRETLANFTILRSDSAYFAEMFTAAVVEAQHALAG